ncbi:MAG: hypothetical protein NVS1B10_07460 [Candidatus Saccharimonadales bacterium]
MPLSSGAVSLSSRSSTSINLNGAVATGGTGPYTYQWYRSTGIDMVWSALAGKTTATSCNDTTVSGGVMYAYLLVSTDTGVTPNVVTASNVVGPVLAQSAPVASGAYTYAASITGFTPVATPTDIFNIFGSATKSVLVTRIEVTGITSSATASALDLQLIKRNTAGTLGTAVLTGVTAVPVDTNNPAATAVVSTVGTANYTTLGNLVGVVASKKLALTLSPATATDFPVGQVVSFAFNDLNEQGIVLRGTSDQLALGLNSATLPAGTALSINITWEEI